MAMGLATDALDHAALAAARVQSARSQRLHEQVVGGRHSEAAASFVASLDYIPAPFETGGRTGLVSYVHGLYSVMRADYPGLDSQGGLGPLYISAWSNRLALSEWLRFMKGTGRTIREGTLDFDGACALYRPFYRATQLDSAYEQEWVKYECNCLAFYAAFVCKHALALALKNHQVPATAHCTCTTARLLQLSISTCITADRLIRHPLPHPTFRWSSGHWPECDGALLMALLAAFAVVAFCSSNG